MILKQLIVFSKSHSLEFSCSISAHVFKLATNSLRVNIIPITLCPEKLPNTVGSIGLDSQIQVWVTKSFVVPARTLLKSKQPTRAKLLKRRWDQRCSEDCLITKKVSILYQIIIKHFSFLQNNYKCCHLLHSDWPHKHHLTKSLMKLLLTSKSYRLKKKKKKSVLEWLACSPRPLARNC